jgi:stage II sporulation protein D
MDGTRAWLPVAAALILCVGAASSRATPEEEEGGAPPAATPLLVRVHLASAGTPGQVTLRGSTLLRVRDDASGALLATRESAVVLRGDGSEVVLGERRGKAVRVSAGEGGLVVLGDGNRRRMYPGSLLVSSNGARLTLRNECELEQYTAGVLAGECPALFHREAIRAMAVAARSYSFRRAAAARMAGPGEVPGRRQQPRELCDMQHCQVYLGIGAARPSILEAVKDTTGLVALHEGEVIDAVYSSDCGGHTAASEEAWRGARAVPYLRPVEDAPEPGAPAFCSLNRGHAWSLDLPRERLARLLDGRPGPLRVVIVEQTVSGRASQVEVARLAEQASSDGEPERAVSAARRWSGEEWRRVLGPAAVRSLRFTVEEAPHGFALRGTGYGHGVGLCQFGANGMARQGRRFDEILAHYYTGIRIGPAPR